MTWHDFEQAAPELAETGRSRLHGRVSYLATLRSDGTPRAHPVTPIIGDGYLFLFMEPTSPKGRDLVRGSGYALHCGVEDTEGGGGEFAVTGRARLVEDAATIALARSIAPYRPADRYILFELTVETALSTTYTDTGPVRSRWHAAR